MVKINGGNAFDANIVSHIENPQDQHIVFKNVTFGCETIEDAEGTVFVKRKTGHWIYDGDPATLVCDHCGYRVMVYNNTKFCPDCGFPKEV